MIRLHLPTGETAGTLADLQTGLRAEAAFDPVSFAAFRIEAAPADGGGQGQRQVSHVEGTVGAVDAEAGTITINPRSGSPVALTTDSSTRITRNGAAATLADVKAGDHAAAEYVTATNVATRIEAENDSEQEPAEVEGQVTAASDTSITIAPRTGDSVTLTLDSSTVILVNGKPGAAADIKVGDKAEAVYDATTKVASKVAVESETESEPAEVEGHVTAATSASVTILPEHGDALTLTLSSTTVIFAGDKPGTVADIQPGRAIQALYDKTTLAAVSIRVAAGDGGGHH
jgi:hypothetical protein